MKKNRKITDEFGFLLMLIAYIILCIVLGVSNIKLMFIAIGIGLVAVVISLLSIGKLKAAMSKVLMKSVLDNGEADSILSETELPVMLSNSEGKILWVNEVFGKQIGNGRNVVLENTKDVFENFSPEDCTEAGGSELMVGDDHFEAFSQLNETGNGTVYITYFIRDTELYENSEEYLNSKPVVMMFVVDNYDETITSASEHYRSDILFKVSNEIERFVNSVKGVLFSLSSKDFVAIVEERHMDRIVQDKFSVLDRVREIETGGLPVTLSIGVGRYGTNLYENRVIARDSLSMALGRGGDQAAMKTASGYSFFGGSTKAVEKRNKVKARLVAQDLGDVIKRYQKILIMGHRYSDLDAVGSCIGLAKICQVYGRKAMIVTDPETTLAKQLYSRALITGMNDVFITPAEGYEYADANTLVIVTDCHSRTMLDMPETLDKTRHHAVVDHHRLTVSKIEDTELFYHETSSSSCCEMVTELIEYTATAEVRLNPFEATALLSGIMLDTKNFSLQTGVRTYDAASYLRSCGADPAEARKYLATDFDVYRLKSRLVSDAEFYKGCAVVISEDRDIEGLKLAIPQTADELLNVEGVKASIAAAYENGEYRISARSFGLYNVQLIMEELGGGGHQTMAGAQLKDIGTDELKTKIFEAIDNYLAKNKGVGR